MTDVLAIERIDSTCTLLDCCATDLAVVNAARVSFASRSDEWGDRDGRLLRFLMREHHGTPFEHGYLRFRVEAPIFVFREWHRHRVGHSYNEVSARYVELEPRFYTPERMRMQTGTAYACAPLGDDRLNDHASNVLLDAYRDAWCAYRRLLDLGVAREQARAVLPLGIYSSMVWSCNPRSLMHFLSLRYAPEAQQEIRELAEQAEAAFTVLMPVTHAAFVANGRSAP